MFLGLVISLYINEPWLVNDSRIRVVRGKSVGLDTEGSVAKSSK